MTIITIRVSAGATYPTDIVLSYTDIITLMTVIKTLILINLGCFILQTKQGRSPVTNPLLTVLCSVMTALSLLLIVQSIYENYWHNLKQIATEFFSAGMHSGEVSLKHTKNPLRHLWGRQVKSAIKVTFFH